MGLKEREMITGFRLIQEIGLKGMEFESTSNYTLRFEEAKSIALLVLKEIQASDMSKADIDNFINEVENTKM